MRCQFCRIYKKNVFIVAWKGLKTKFRVKVLFRDPYYLTQFWGVAVMKFCSKTKYGWVMAQKILFWPITPKKERFWFIQNYTLYTLWTSTNLKMQKSQGALFFNLMHHPGVQCNKNLLVWLIFFCNWMVTKNKIRCGLEL